MDEGAFSEPWPDLRQGCTVLVAQFLFYADDTHLYISDQDMFSCVYVREIILMKVPL